MFTRIFVLSLALFFAVACQKSAEQTVFIPKANFKIYNNNCKAPCETTFYNTSIVDVNTTFLWDFGDGTKATTKHGKKKFEQDGYYTIRLIAKNLDGENSITQTVQIERENNLSSFGKCFIENIEILEFPLRRLDNSPWDTIPDASIFPDLNWQLQNESGRTMQRSQDASLFSNVSPQKCPLLMPAITEMQTITDFKALYRILIRDYDLSANEIMTEFRFQPQSFFPANPSSGVSEILIEQNGFKMKVRLIWNS